MTIASETAPDEARKGFAAVLAANVTWGVLPLYLKLLAFAPAHEVLAGRILASAPFAAAVVAVTGGFAAVRADLRRKGMLPALTLSAVLIAVNWGIYVWAVAHGHVIEASLAYFLTPLVNVAFGVALFGERLNRLQIVALAFAALGVVVQTAALGAPPWIAIGLCASWSVYGLVRKQAQISAAGGFFAETLVLAGPALLALALLAHTAPLAITSGPGALALIALAGPLTAIPLICFAFGARRVSFTTLGLVQYVAPSLQFAIGAAYGEALTPLRLASFAAIWIGLALFSLDAWRRRRDKEA